MQKKIEKRGRKKVFKLVGSLKISFSYVNGIKTA
jgi:hypothetical protein